MSLRTCGSLRGALRGPSWEPQDGHMDAFLQRKDEPRDCTVGMGTKGRLQSHSESKSHGFCSPDEKRRDKEEAESQVGASAVEAGCE